MCSLGSIGDQVYLSKLLATRGIEISTTQYTSTSSTGVEHVIIGAYVTIFVLQS